MENLNLVTAGGTLGLPSWLGVDLGAYGVVMKSLISYLTPPQTTALAAS